MLLRHDLCTVPVPMARQARHHDNDMLSHNLDLGINVDADPVVDALQLQSGRILTPYHRYIASKRALRTKPVAHMDFGLDHSYSTTHAYVISDQLHCKPSLVWMKDDGRSLHA